MDIKHIMLNHTINKKCKIKQQAIWINSNFKDNTHFQQDSKK